MAAPKSPLIDKFLKPFKNLSNEERDTKLGTIIGLAEVAADSISRTYGVPKKDVVDLLVNKILNSNDKFPDPSDQIQGDRRNKRKINEYIKYLWDWYGCPNNKSTIAKKTRRGKKGALASLSINTPTKQQVAAAKRKEEQQKKKEEEAAAKKEEEEQKKKQAKEKSTAGNKKKKPPEAKPRIKPTVEISLSSQVVRKNGEVTIYWTSENAVRVLDNNFGLRKNSKETTGQKLDDKIKKERKYWIIVENDYGDTARDEIELVLDDADYDPLKNLINEVRQEEGPVPAGEAQQNQQPQQETTQPIVNRQANVRLGGDQVNRVLEDIKKITEDILTNLTNQSLLSKQTIAVQRRESETQRRQKRESIMETPKKLGSQLMSSSLMKPVKSLWDWLVNFITYVILGRMFVKILKWVTDPQNKEKVDSLKRFLKDFGPALFATFVLFGTSFGKFVRSLVGTVFNLSKFLITKGIPTLVGILKNLGPKGRLAAAVIVGGIAARQVLSQLYKSKEDEKTQQPQSQQPKPKKDEKTQQPQSQQPKPKKEKDPYQFTMPQMRGGGQVKKFNSFPLLDALNVNAQDMMYNAGGLISELSGVTIKGAKDDTQLVATQPGEVIISKKAVDYFGGPELFLKMNQMGGGTNQPTFSNNVQLAAGGGLVGSRSKPSITNNNNTRFNPSLNLPAVNLAVGKLKHHESLSSLTKGSNDYIRPGHPSTVSRTPWNKVSGNTPIHAYADDTGKPTIGWGSTYYDSITNGTQKVKLGDVINKSRADSIFQNQVMNLAETYSSKIKYWPQMSNEQRAGLLLTGFNVPNAPLGNYPALTNALNTGNMREASQNIQRMNVSRDRIQLEKSMLMSGPLDLTKVSTKQSQPQTQSKEQSKPKNFIQRIGESFSNLFRPKSAGIQPQSSNVLPSQSIQQLPVKTPEIGPSKNVNNVSFVNLAPIVAGQQKQMAQQMGTDIPEFSAVSFAIEERMNNASTYGIA